MPKCNMSKLMHHHAVYSRGTLYRVKNNKMALLHAYDEARPAIWIDLSQLKSVGIPELGYIFVAPDYNTKSVGIHES